MSVRTMSALGAAFLLMSAASMAQDKKLDCGEESGRRNRVCEMREMSAPITGKLDVDAAPNGGISVKAWDRNEILVRAKVEAWGDSISEARDRLKEVAISTTGAHVKSTGPVTSSLFNRGDQKWSVSYEVFTPRKIDLALESVNGGIRVAGISGNMKFETVNGGVNIDIAGARWEGEGLNVETVNGGVTLTVPAGFSAQVHAETVNGGLTSDFEGAQVQGRHGPKKMDLKLGAGGPPVHVETVNGGVRIKRKA